VKKKTSIYHNEGEIARLAWLAEQECVPQAEIIRKAIGAYVPEGGSDRNFRLLASGEGPGNSIVDLTEDELLAGFGE
jgi:hypothetical protein